MDVLYFVYYLSLVWFACGRIAGDFQSIWEAVPGDRTISQKAEPDGDGLTVHLPECPLYEETAAPEEAPEPLEAPALTTPFYMDARLEEAPTREKIGPTGSGESKPRRRHRGGRRRGGKGAEGAEQPEARRPEQKESRPRPPRQEAKPAQPRPAEGQAPGGEGEAKRRRRPHHRGGRRRNKGGEGGGSAPKSE